MCGLFLSFLIHLALDLITLAPWPSNSGKWLCGSDSCTISPVSLTFPRTGQLVGLEKQFGLVEEFRFGTVSYKGDREKQIFPLRKTVISTELG